MNYRTSLIFLTGLLTGCGLNELPPAPLLAIAEGRYQSVIDEACITLEFGRRGRQTIQLDAGCDGAVEVQSAFQVVENIIQSDVGVFTVTAVGGASFSGLWSQGDTATEARFERLS